MPDYRVAVNASGASGPGTSGTSSAPSTPTSTIAGIGMDLIAIHRIARIWRRYGEHFALKILGEQERACFQARRARDPARGLRFLATRFAAKEAFAKAIGMGMRSPMGWTQLQILPASNGRPVLVLAPPLLAWYTARFGAAHVSLTDTLDMAAATVVVESKMAAPAAVLFNPASETPHVPPAS